MSATEEGDGEWTLDTLHAHLRLLIAANDARYSERFDAQQLAIRTAVDSQKLSVDKVEVATEKRFESVNEFRATLSDQQRLFMPRNESTALLKGMDDKLLTAQLTFETKIETLRLSMEKNVETFVRENIALREAVARLVTRSEADTAIELGKNDRLALTNRVNALEQANANLQGRMWALSVGITLVSIAVSIALHFIGG